MNDAPFATVRLCDEGTLLEATFVPDAGMICSSLRHRGEELLAQNTGVLAYAQRGTTMGIPLLYPWANRLAGFSTASPGARCRSRTTPPAWRSTTTACRSTA
jgi:aldose 1-epimerase